MGHVIDLPEFREKTHVFLDRHDAGRQLAALIERSAGTRYDRILAIPAGGVPVGVELSRALHVPLSLAIVRKIQIPGKTEAGFGAVTWDGKVRINERLVRTLQLSEAEVNHAIAKTKKNISDRILRFSGGKPLPDLRGGKIIVTDDGLASGFTMLATLENISTYQPASVAVAVPTAPLSITKMVAEVADLLICLNVRSGPYFAVADAYWEWSDLSDREVMMELANVSSSDGAQR